MRYLNYGAAVSEASALIVPFLSIFLLSTISNLIISLHSSIHEVNALTGGGWSSHRRNYNLRIDIIYHCWTKPQPCSGFGTGKPFKMFFNLLKFRVCALFRVLYSNGSLGIYWSPKRKISSYWLGSIFVGWRSLCSRNWIFMSEVLDKLRWTSY